MQQLRQPLQGLFRRQDGKRAGALTGFGQFQHQIVATDQQVGMTRQRQFQKHLVIRVAASGQQGQRQWQGLGHECDVRPVGVKQALLAGFVEFELLVADYPGQFGQGWIVGQTAHRAGFNRRHQRRERWCPEVKQVHHHVGVEYEARRRYV